MPLQVRGLFCCYFLAGGAGFVVGLVYLVNFSEGIYCQVTQWDLQKRTHCSWPHSQEQIGRKRFLSAVAQLMRDIFTKL